MKNFKIGAKLSLSFGLIIALIAFGSVMSFINIKHINQMFTHDVRKSFIKLDEVLQLDTAASTYAHSMLAAVKFGEVQKNNAVMFFGFANKALEDVKNRESALLSKIDLKSIDRPIIEKMISSRENLQQSLEEVEKLLKKGDEAGGDKLFKSQVMDAWNNYQANKKAVLDYYKTDYSHKEQSIISNNNTSIGRLVIQGFLTILFSLILGYYLSKSITTPLNEALQLSKEIADGHFKKLDQNRTFGTNETEQLLKSMYGMNFNLRDVISRIGTSSSQVQTAASEIAQGNNDLSSRTEEQAASLEETAATMEQITVTIKNTSDHAGQANTLATQISNHAQQGASLMKDVSTKVYSIRDSSKKIEEIISVINNIAFQTNILALNAAVEAARAGEHGKGFAVVASEVRALSQKSATAATEIKALILESTQKVNESVEFTESVENRILEITEGFKKVSAIIEHINVSANEQSHSVAQINSVISQMDQITQQNAALVEESAAAATALSQQSSDLDATIKQFKVY